MSESDEIERLREALNEALLNIEGIQEQAAQVHRRLREHLEMIDYERDGD